MGQPVDEPAVIGNGHQPFAVQIEPTGWVERRRDAQAAQRRASEPVARGGKDARRLVGDDVAMRLPQLRPSLSPNPQGGARSAQGAAVGPGQGPSLARRA